MEKAPCAMIDVSGDMTILHSKESGFSYRIKYVLEYTTCIIFLSHLFWLWPVGW